MEETKIINIKSDDFYDVYIGRYFTRKHETFYESFFANPFRIGRDGTGSEVLKKYKNHLCSKESWQEEIEKLRGKILGCWCKPGPCHGDVLIELLEDQLPRNWIVQLSEGAYLYARISGTRETPDPSEAKRYKTKHGAKIALGRCKRHGWGKRGMVRNLGEWVG